MYDTSGDYGEAACAVNSAVCQEQGFDCFNTGTGSIPITDRSSLPQSLSTAVTKNRPDGVQTCVAKDA